MKIIFLVFLSIFSSCANLQNPMKMHQSAEGFNWDDDFISVMQGPATQNETVINFIIPKHLKYEVIVLKKEGKVVLENAIKSEKTETREFSPWKIIEVELGDLRPRTPYLFVINLFNGKRSLSETREFSTLDTSSENLKFAVASCMSDHYSHIGNMIWPVVHKNDPQFYLLIGDQVYIDVYGQRYLNFAADHRQIWQRYVSSRNLLALYRQEKLKPIYAIWDDHDYGKNNGNKHYKYKNDALKVLRTFFPLPKFSNIQKGPGASFTVNLGTQNFFFLDNRSFRDENDVKEGEHFGAKQTSWFLEKLKQSKSNGNWIISGDQFFGGYHQFESFEGNHPEKFKSFLNSIKLLDKKVVFISGDRHLAEIMKIESQNIGYDTYEITSSAIHSTIFPGSLNSSPNKRRLDGVDNRYNFGLIEVDNKDNFKFNFKAKSQSNLTILNYNFLIK